MITLKELLSAINYKITPLGIDINESDVKKGFKRPSFFVKMENSYRVDYPHYFIREIDFAIYYFPSDKFKYQLEMVEMQEKLEEIFGEGIEVKDRFISLKDEIESEEVDGVLRLFFTLIYDDVRVEKGGEGSKKMEILDYDGIGLVKLDRFRAYVEIKHKQHLGLEEYTHSEIRKGDI